MGASDVVDLSRAAPARPAGGMQQVAQHKGGAGAQGMRPLTEAVQHKGGAGAQGMRPLTEAVQHKGGAGAQGMRPLTEAVQHKGGAGAQGMRPLTEAVQHKGGAGAQGMRPLTEAVQHKGGPVVQVEKEKMGRAYMQKQAMIWDMSSKQEPNLHTVPHAPESAIPGLPNMFMQMIASNRSVKIAHTSAVEQGLAGADTFAMCRRSFLTWMAGTPMAQLSKQGTNLEQENGIERQLLRDTDNAAYCLDLLKTLGFSWCSGERTKITTKGDAGPLSNREPAQERKWEGHQDWKWDGRPHQRSQGMPMGGFILPKGRSHPPKLGIPDYFTIVKEPMDLNAIVAGIESGAYSHFSQVYHHVLLVFTNAMLYNPPENPIHQLALKVCAAFASRAMISMHQLQGLQEKSQVEPGKWPPPGSRFPLAPMPEANPSLEQAFWAHWLWVVTLVCEELSEKSKGVEKLKLKQSEDLERYIRLGQYLEEVTDLNRQQLQSKDEQIAELYQELLNHAQQNGAPRGEGEDMEVERPAGGEQGEGEDAQGGRQQLHAAATATAQLRTSSPAT
eukprot:gene31473-6661_t